MVAISSLMWTPTCLEISLIAFSRAFGSLGILDFGHFATSLRAISVAYSVRVSWFFMSARPEISLK